MQITIDDSGFVFIILDLLGSESRHVCNVVCLAGRMSCLRYLRKCMKESTAFCSSGCWLLACMVMKGPAWVRQNCSQDDAGSDADAAGRGGGADAYADAGGDGDDDDHHDNASHPPAPPRESHACGSGHWNHSICQH